MKSYTPKSKVTLVRSKLLQRAAVSAAPANAVPPIVHEVLRSPGQPLDAGTRAFMEPRFGHDFSGVRVHTDARAAESARAVNALAYTVGRDVVFGAGQHTPGTSAGQRLMAHELTHVVQQGRASETGPLLIAEIESSSEIEAAQIETAQSVGQPQEQPFIKTRSELGLYMQHRPGAGHTRGRSDQTPVQTPLAAAQTEAIARDYTDAQTYITDFYNTYARIQDDLAEAAHRSINRFSEITGITDSRLGANITYQLIRIVLGVLPGTQSVIGMFDVLSRGLPLAINGSRLATIAGVVAQRGAAGMFTANAPSVSGTSYATAAALDTLSLFDTEGAARIEQERTEVRSIVEQIGRDPTYRNTVLTEVHNGLGPLPKYNAQVIQHFEQEYELRLYRNYYIHNAWINHKPPSFLGNPYTSYVIYGVPKAVQLRILDLQRQRGYVAQVSIDERFSLSNPNYAETVKVLLDWGVELYWLRGYISDRPETLYTGDNLRQPYRGERFREVR